MGDWKWPQMMKNMKMPVMMPEKTMTAQSRGIWGSRRYLTEMYMTATPVRTAMKVAKRLPTKRWVMRGSGLRDSTKCLRKRKAHGWESMGFWRLGTLDIYRPDQLRS